MSVDPAAALAAGNNAAVEAIITAELNALASDAQNLQQQVAVGDVVPATVLPPNGLTDLISILGNRVAASLPPTLTPGDQLTVQVTGFNGSQILLQILSASEGPAATGTPIPPPAGGETPPPGASGTTTTAPTTAPPPSTPGIAPPSSVFVAATVRPNAPVPPPIPPGGSVPEPPPDAPPGTIPGAPGTTLPPPIFGGIEARLAAARAASVQILAPAPLPPGQLPPSANAPTALRTPPPPLASPPSSSPAASEPAAASAAPAAPAPASAAPPPGRPLPAAPAAATTPSVPLPVRGFVSPPPIVTARSPFGAPPPGPVPAGGQAPAPSTAAAFQDPLALVRALKLPVTPSNLAAAKLALDAPQRLPAALATLESALPQSDDPRVTTLRAITAFIGKIEPSSPQLATQIAAYVEHVVSGSEPQLAQLLGAYAEESAAATAPVEPAAAATSAATAAEAVPAEAATAAAAEPALPVVALAQIVERAATIAVSLKEQIFSLVSGPPVTGRGGDVVALAATSALSAVTSVQLAAAQAAGANAQTMSFAIPMWLGQGGYAQAQLSVDRDAPDTPNVPLDGDNFHIAFVLDTKHLGTVAIDLRTVGRAFALSVKTENLRTAQRFGDELSRLTDRLASLRYQPKSVEAVVAGPATSASPEIAVPVVTDPLPAAASADDPTEFNQSA